MPRAESALKAPDGSNTRQKNSPSKIGPVPVRCARMMGILGGQPGLDGGEMVFVLRPIGHLSKDILDGIDIIAPHHRPRDAREMPRGVGHGQFFLYPRRAQRPSPEFVRDDPLANLQRRKLKRIPNVTRLLFSRHGIGGGDRPRIRKMRPQGLLLLPNGRPEGP